MSSYKNILIALECSHNTEQVLAKGAEIKALYPDASYSLVHVVLDVIIADWAGLPGQVPPAIDQQELAQAGARLPVRLGPHTEAIIILIIIILLGLLIT